MRTNQTSWMKQRLIAGLLAVPLSLAAGDIMAQSCKNGSCGGPNNLEKAVQKVEAAGSTVASADLETAYKKIESVAKEANDLNVGDAAKVRTGLKELVSKLEKRAAADLEDAIDRYFEGYQDESLAKFEEISKLKGTRSGKKAQAELDKEEDRVAWREAHKLATQYIGDKSFGDAREPLNDMQRLARRTDYTKQSAAAMKDYSKELLTEVEAAEAMIEKQQYETAYATLIEISRLSHARESSLAARKVLGKHATLEGMRMAKAEYDAGDALAKAKSWFSEIAHPSPQERKLFEQKLEAIADSYKGTQAASQAQQLLGDDNAQAAAR